MSTEGICGDENETHEKEEKSVKGPGTITLATETVLLDILTLNQNERTEINKCEISEINVNNELGQPRGIVSNFKSSSQSDINLDNHVDGLIPWERLSHTDDEKEYSSSAKCESLNEDHIHKLEESSTSRESLTWPFSKSNSLDARHRHHLTTPKTAVVLPSVMGNRYCTGGIRLEGVNSETSKIESGQTGTHLGSECTKTLYIGNKLTRNRTLDKGNCLPSTVGSNTNIVCDNRKVLKSWGGNNCIREVYHNPISKSVLPEERMETNTVHDFVNEIESHENIDINDDSTNDPSTENEPFQHDLVTQDRSNSPTFSEQDSLEDIPLTDEIEAVSSEGKDSLDIDDESSSMHRILAWDPWAKLGIRNDAFISSGAEDENDAAESIDTMEHTITVVQSAPVAPLMPILKGTPRLVCSDVANNKRMSEEGTRGATIHPVGDIGIETNRPASVTRSEKRVQWSQEVEVIYYAGDSEGGTVLGTQLEPLHEESEQQARAIHFARACSKNFNATLQFPFLEPWFPLFRMKK